MDDLELVITLITPYSSLVIIASIATSVSSVSSILALEEFLSVLP